LIILTSLLYLAVCGFVALQALSWLSRHTQKTDTMTTYLVIVSAFAIAFFLGFHILGYINLATGKAVVVLPNALAVLLVPAIILSLANRQANQKSIQQPAVVLAPRGRIFDTYIAKAVLLTYCIVGVMLAFGFPQGFEVMAYHLPNAVEILQSHSLRAWDGNFPHTFPANASVFYAFMLDVLPEKLVSAADLVLLLPLVLSVAGISLLIGADRKASELVVCGLLTVPIVAFSAVELGADIGGIAFISAAMYFALARDFPSLLRASLAGACAGLAFGFKSLHLISIAFLSMLIFAQGWSGASTTLSRTWQGTKLAAVFCAAVLLTSGFWLVRNFIDFGNPLHPVNLPVITDILGWVKAPGVDFTSRHSTQFEWVRTPMEWLVYPWIEWHDNGQNFKHSSGLGAFFAASVPIGILAISVAVVTQGIRPHCDRFTLLLAILFVGVLWWALDDRQPRYMLSAIVYSMPLVAWVVTQADKRWRGVYDAILGLCIATALLVFLSKQALLFGDRIVFSGYSTRTQFYEYPPEVDTLPAGATILNLADRAWHYPLAGNRLSNHVISMPEGRRMLGLEPSLTAPKRVELQAPALLASGITHIFADSAELIPDACTGLREVGKFDRNPTNGKMLAVPRILVAVTYTNFVNPSECKPRHGKEAPGVNSGRPL
jgi:hypothetical protein